MTPPLTAAQMRTLRQIADHSVCSGMDYTPIYEVTDEHGNPDFVRLRSATVERLVTAGLVLVRSASLADGYRATVCERVYRVTAAGRDALR